MTPRILALDTSTDACSVALQTGSEVIGCFEVVPRKHTQLLLPMVESVMAESGVGFDQLDAIAFGRGPGSFAGLRIATGAAQGLALANDTPMIGISTLETLALAQAINSADAQNVLAVLDARMDEVYWACFTISDGVPVLIGEEQVSKPSALVLPEGFSDFDLVGSGVRYLDQMPQQLRDSIDSVDGALMPDAKVMLHLAEMKYAQGEMLAIEQALPVYLREGTWKKRSEQ